MIAADATGPRRSQPDPAMIALYADVVFGYCEGWVPVRALAEKGAADAPPHTPFLEADGELAAAARAAGRLGRRRRHGALRRARHGRRPRARPAPSTSRRRRWCWSTSTMATSPPSASISSATSARPPSRSPPAASPPEGQRKLHLYWRLTEPAEGEDIARVCRAAAHDRHQGRRRPGVPLGAPADPGRRLACTPSPATGAWSRSCATTRATTTSAS